MKCLVKGCEKKAEKRGWCEKHYMRWYTHGDAEKRSRYDPNEIIVGNFFCLMKLYNRQGVEIATTFFDREDLPKVQGHKWGLDGRGYVRFGKAYGPKLHQVILNAPYGDHIDGNKLNNCRSNLRFCSHQENICNQRKRADNKSGFKGVCWYQNRWVAQINSKGKHYYLGRFKNKMDAIIAYNEAAAQLHGEFARFNKL